MKCPAGYVSTRSRAALAEAARTAASSAAKRMRRVNLFFFLLLLSFFRTKRIFTLYPKILVSFWVRFVYFKSVLGIIVA